MAKIDLSEDLVYYFGLFLIKREDDGEASSKCSDHELIFLHLIGEPSVLI